MTKFILSALLVFVLFSSCKPRLSSGVVVNKFYEQDETIMIVQYDPVLGFARPFTYWDDADYVLIVRGFNGDELIEQRFEVSEFVYNTKIIGDSISLK